MNPIGDTQPIDLGYEAFPGSAIRASDNKIDVWVRLSDQLESIPKNVQTLLGMKSGQEENDTLSTGKRKPLVKEPCPWKISKLFQEYAVRYRESRCLKAKWLKQPGFVVVERHQEFCLIKHLAIPKKQRDPLLQLFLLHAPGIEHTMWLDAVRDAVRSCRVCSLSENRLPHAVNVDERRALQHLAQLAGTFDAQYLFHPVRIVQQVPVNKRNEWNILSRFECSLFNFRCRHSS